MVNTQNASAQRYRCRQRRHRQKMPQKMLQRVIVRMVFLTVFMLAGAAVKAVLMSEYRSADKPVSVVQADEALVPVSQADGRQTWKPQTDEMQNDPMQAGGSAVDREDWKLLLVNPWNPVPEDYSIRTVELRNGFCIDERCYSDLQEMMDACRADGLFSVICSAYRTQERQEELYFEEAERCLPQGLSFEDAQQEAGRSVAVPGISEHQLGLAVDIVDMDNRHLDESQECTAVQQWLINHSCEYGFILRYPNEKSSITGIIYEPWHYRYAGREHAEQIHRLGVCLEEYLDELQSGEAR